MKLNIGGAETHDGGTGSPQLIEFTNVDIRRMPGVDLVIDINKELPFKNESIEEIRASHIIEHFGIETIKKILNEFGRILQKGGLLRIYCPDVEILAHDYISGNIDMVEFSRNLFGKQTYKYNLHRVAFDRHRLDELIENAGFNIISRDPRPNAYKYDLGVQAVKI